MPNSENFENNQLVDYINDKQDAVQINVHGIKVQFECQNNDCVSQKANIKISKLYKNQQCGICGHYDDNENNEWRMSNDKASQNLMQFHQSYTLKDNECNFNEHDSFYSEQNKKEFSIESQESVEEYHNNDKKSNQKTSSEEEQKWDRRDYKKQLKRERKNRRNNNQQNEGKF